GGHPETVRGALAWLVEQKGPGGVWGSTQATVLALKALLEGTGKPLGEDGERVIEVALGPFRPTVRIPAGQADVLVPLDLSKELRPGEQTLTLTEKSASPAGFQATFRYHVPGSPALPEREPLAIQISYDRTELSVGEELAARATVTNKLPQA